MIYGLGFSWQQIFFQTFVIIHSSIDVSTIHIFSCKKHSHRILCSLFILVLQKMLFTTQAENAIRYFSLFHLIDTYLSLVLHTGWPVETVSQGITGWETMFRKIPETRQVSLPAGHILTQKA